MWKPNRVGEEPGAGGAGHMDLVPGAEGLAHRIVALRPASVEQRARMRAFHVDVRACRLVDIGRIKERLEAAGLVETRRSAYILLLPLSPDDCELIHHPLLVRSLYRQPVRRDWAPHGTASNPPG
ncbi:hypothetical protein GCM10011611_31320 [Aliidongia dinghuensis]|uniref:Uncharacterized protein n=1 Tax=Aliidongia dinghuensis TaxID=1867774 RepID=A0A8J2YV56_9PROT|nr:hypothetical protein GCM10011611_31320 [Aliidongia dinghuensis]